MKYYRVMLIVFGGLTIYFNSFAIGVENFFKTPLIFLQILPQLIDLKLIGAPMNYYHNFPEENYHNKKERFEFNNLITFGDSLSDQGSNGRYSMYIAGGYDKISYVDYLSKIYTGKISKPQNVGGLNYAQRAATIEKIQPNMNSITEQVDLYLSHSKGKADSNSLYLLWGGAMDINVYIGTHIIQIISGKYDIGAKDFSLGNGPKITAEIAQKLIDKGASYVFVPNIPDSSLLPYSMMMISEQFFENTLGRLNIPYTWLISEIGKRTDNFLRNPANLIAAKGKEFVRLNHINAISTQIFWYLPRPIVVFLYDWIANLQKNITSQYNYSLNQSLKNIRGNIVYFDFASFLEEVILHYEQYHIDSILVPTCTLGYSSRYCDTHSPKYHKGRYLFGDWFHPGPETHIAIGQYIQSIFNAPLYMYSMLQHVENLNQTGLFFINQQLELARLANHQTDMTNGPTLILGVSGGIYKYKSYIPNHQTDSNLLNIGLYNVFNSNWLWGGLLSFSWGKNKPYDLLSYHFNYENIHLFFQYNWKNDIWSRIGVSLGRLESNNITRSVPILEAILHTKGQTKVYSTSLQIKTGWNLFHNNRLAAGPSFEIGTGYFKLNAFQEKGQPFLAMKYGKYYASKHYIGLGWYLFNQKLQIAQKPLHLNAEIKLSHLIGKPSVSIPASIQTAPVMFKRKISNLNKQWLNVNTGIAFFITNNTRLMAQIGYMTNLKRNKSINYSIGINCRFK